MNNPLLTDQRLELERLEAARETKSLIKGALLGLYLGSLIAVLLAYVPAICAELTPQPAWVKNHWTTYLWLASLGLAFCIFIGIVRRFEGLGILVIKVIGGLFVMFLAGLFFGWVGFTLALFGCCGAFDEHHCCGCPEHRELPKIRYRHSSERSAVPLSLAGRWVLRMAALAALIYVWILLANWYQHDADTAWPPKEVQADNPS